MGNLTIAQDSDSTASNKFCNEKISILEREGYKRLSAEARTASERETDEESSSSSGTEEPSSASEQSSSWLSGDDEGEWSEREWPANQPLPVPLYGLERPRLALASPGLLQRLQEAAAALLQEGLSSDPYDSLTTFFQFCKEYHEYGSEYSSLYDFFRDYNLPIMDGRNTCVGLVHDLRVKLTALENKFPGVSDSMFPVSCDEKIKHPETYCSGSYPPYESCDKEHLFLCISFELGQRRGVMLMDPGYHVSVPIIVMEDGCYPHSPPYQARIGHQIKTYTYKFHEGNSSFVEWNVRKGDMYRTNLVFVNRPFLSGMDNAERRNLVYPVKTVTNREENGDIKSGLYLSLKLKEELQVVFLFGKEDGSLDKVRVPLDYFSSSPSVQLDSSITLGRNDYSENSLEWDAIIQHVGDDAGRADEILRVLAFLSDFFHMYPKLMPEIREINEKVIRFSEMN